MPLVVIIYIISIHVDGWIDSLTLVLLLSEEATHSARAPVNSTAWVKVVSSLLLLVHLMLDVPLEPDHLRRVLTIITFIVAII